MCHGVALVAHSEAPYTETGGSKIDLARLADPWDGRMDQEHAMRDRTEGHLVHLRFHKGNVGGDAEFGGPIGLTCQGCGGPSVQSREKRAWHMARSVPTPIRVVRDSLRFSDVRWTWQGDPLGVPVEWVRRD